MGLIYMRTSPSGGRYIGQTIFPEEKRWENHINEANNLGSKNYNSLLNKAIRKYGENNFNCNILEDNLPDEKLDEREIYWIGYYKTYYLDGNHGYNMTRGGGGSKKADVEKILDLWNKGFIIKEIAEQLQIGRQAVSKHLRLNGITLEEIQARSQKAIQKAKEPFLKNCHQEVVQLWNEGYSIKEIQKKLNVSANYVRKDLVSAGIPAEERRQRGYKKSLAKSVCQYDLNGNLIKEWNSASEASLALKISNSCISQVCRGNAKTAGGFIWKFKNLTN